MNPKFEQCDKVHPSRVTDNNIIIRIVSNKCGSSSSYYYDIIVIDYYVLFQISTMQNKVR